VTLCLPDFEQCKVMEATSSADVVGASPSVSTIRLHGLEFVDEGACLTKREILDGVCLEAISSNVISVAAESIAD